LRERAVGGGRIIALAQALHVEAQPSQWDAMLLDPAFPRRLARRLAAPTRAPDRALAVDVEPSRGASERWEAPQRFDPELEALIVVLFLLERFAAGRRASRRATPP
jgi:hypothetical protein